MQQVKVKNVEILGKHLIGREQSRHPFAVILLVTTLWRLLPSCFAAMLFCADKITRRRCGARSKVKGHRPFALIQLSVRVRVRVSNPNSVVFGLILMIMALFSRRVWVQNRFEPVSCSFFLLFWNVRTTSWNFPCSRKETRSRIFTLLAD